MRSLSRLASDLHPENAILIYQVKHGDSLSKILNRIAGRTLSGKLLEASLQTTKTLNPQIQDINKIFPGMWICIMHPLFGANSIPPKTELQRMHSFWENLAEQEKIFLTQNWDVIDCLSDIASRTDNVIMTALPKMAPSLSSASIQLSTSIEERIMVHVRQMQSLIVERRKNAARFIFKYFDEIKLERYLVISFKSGRLYSITQRLESFVEMTKRFKVGSIFFGLDITVGGLAVTKTYMESGDANQTLFKAAEVTGKIAGGIAVADSAANICGIAVMTGSTFGLPGLIGGGAICVGAVVGGAIVGEKLGKSFGHATAYVLNKGYHWIYPPTQVTLERISR